MTAEATQPAPPQAPAKADVPHPPKPELALRIGITGHRPNRLGVDAQPKLAVAFRDLLTNFKMALDVVHKRYPTAFADKAPHLTLVSSLAEGADQIAAEVALDLGYSVNSPLPFTVEEYRKDFAEGPPRADFDKLVAQANVFELDGSREAADRAYESAGLFMLRQCDLVVTVWDGKPGAGRGGTYDIVQAARAAGIPIVRFDETAGGPWLLNLAGDLSSVAYDVVTMAHKLEAPNVTQLVNGLCAPPEPVTEHGKTLDRLGDYFSEVEHLRNNAYAYPLLLRLTIGKKGVRQSFRPAPYLPSTKETWEKEYWRPIEDCRAGDEKRDAKAPQNIKETLEPAYAWADGLAVYYAQTYRSSYIWLFFLGALAVSVSLAPLLINGVAEVFGYELTKPWEHVVHFVFAALETFIIYKIGRIFFGGHQRRDHQKWVDYRLLAERLRVVRVLALTASPMPELRAPHGEEALKSQQSWVTWYVRATLRQIGMPSGRGDLQYAKMARHVLIEAELKGQADFHAKSCKRDRRIGHILERSGEILFATTGAIALLVVVFFAIGWFVPCFPPLSDFAMFFSAALPSFGAMFLSLRTHGEFERNAMLSDTAYQRLNKIQHSVENDLRPTFVSIARAIDDTANVLSGELSDWRFVFLGKPLTLPG